MQRQMLSATKKKREWMEKMKKKKIGDWHAIGERASC